MAIAEAPVPHVHKRAPHKVLTLTAMSLGFCVVQLDVTIVNTALNSIGAGLRADVSALQWVVNAYTISFAALILTAGATGDRLGAKRVFMAGFAVFVLASVACAFTPSLSVLIAARAAQGLGAAILVPNALALLNHAYRDPAERRRAVGLWLAGASLALTAGPLVGGALIAIAGWRSIFLVNAPIGAAGLWLAWRYADETTRTPSRRLDLPGQAAAIVTLGALSAAIIEGGKLGWTHPLVLAGLAVAVAAGAFFIWREHRTEQPMLPLGLFKVAGFSVSTGIGVLANAGFYGLIFVLSLYFQRLQHLSPLMTGLAFLPMLAVVLPANLAAPWLSEKLGEPLLIAVGAVIGGLGALGLLPITPTTPYPWLCLPLAALGGGLGLLVPPVTAMLLGAIDKRRSGVASGVLNSARQTGSVIGVALFGALLADGPGFIRGARAAAAISALLFLGSAAIAFLAHHRRGAKAAHTCTRRTASSTAAP